MLFSPYDGSDSWISWLFCAIPLLFVIGMVFCFWRCHGAKWQCCNQTNREEIARLHRELEEIKQKIK